MWLWAIDAFGSAPRARRWRSTSTSPHSAAPRSASCIGGDDDRSPGDRSQSQVNDLTEGIERGAVVVSYDGCRTLKVLNGCSLSGRYEERAARAPFRDTKRLVSEADLASALPLVAATLDAWLSGSRGIEPEAALAK